MANLIGQQLGNYRVIGLLGAGGSAEVYLGEHIHLKRQAAIKVLHRTLTDEQKTDFLIEAQRLVDVSHPSIIQVFDFAIEGDLPYLVMEYAPNGTLRTRHPAGSCLSLETVVSYVKCVATSLQYLHDRKLVHRDVKPENLLIGKNQEILLGDFGIVAIAHKTNSLNMQGQAGTPPYMAPEQSQGLARAASDQYALGIVAYEWLCGSRPFQGPTVALAMQHRSTPPPSLCQRNPTLPPAVERVILKALAKKPQERFRTIIEFAEALEQASQPTQAVPAVSHIERNQISSSPFDAPTILLAEPAQNEYSPSGEVMPLRFTQPLVRLPRRVRRAQNHIPIDNDATPRPPVVRDTSSASRSPSPNSSPLMKALAPPKSKGLSYMIRVVPLIMLVVGIVIIGLVTYRSPSQAAAPLAEDSFDRPDQKLWGTASDGLQWSGDASTNQAFSIKGSIGRIAGGQGPVDALIGPSIGNVDVTVNGIINQSGTDVDLGIVLRWIDRDNWYKAYIDGTHLVILRDFKGDKRIIQSKDVSTSLGDVQTLRFHSFGTKLLAKVWPKDEKEPDWMITVDDPTFSTGRFGIRVSEQPTTVITITHFTATIASTEDDE
jgi:serine/threonine protein kinase